MTEENIRQKFRLRNKDETRNHLTEEIIRNDLMSKKHKKICMAFNYIELLLILSYLMRLLDVFQFLLLLL